MENNRGHITKTEDGYRLRFERMLSHPIQAVWAAITDPEALKYWFTDVDMELRAQSPMRIVFRDNARTATNGRVLEVQPPHRFVWSWENELAEWELHSEGETTTRLIFTYSRMAAEHAVGTAGGFDTLLERLEHYLAGSQQRYPFGTEAADPAQAEKRELYAAEVYDRYPVLEAHHPVVLERVFTATTDDIWQALTDPAKMKIWYFDIAEFRPAVGQIFEWKDGPPGGKQWLHRGQVLEAIPGQKLVHSWEYPGYSGCARLTWQLEPVGTQQTRLKLLFEFVEPFDANEDALRRKHFSQGWLYFFNTGLAAYLENKK